MQECKLATGVSEGATADRGDDQPTKPGAAALRVLAAVKDSSASIFESVNDIIVATKLH